MVRPRFCPSRPVQDYSSNSGNREKLQNCSKVQAGDFDLDGLCSELQKKAKCSGSGAVVEEQEFKTVMRKYLGSTEKEIAECEAKEKAKKAQADGKAVGQMA